MITVNPFKYTEVISVSDVVIDNDVIRLTACILTPDKLAALSFFAGLVPISYVRMMSDPALSSTIADEKLYVHVAISGARLAYGLVDNPTIHCAKSGKKLFTLPTLRDEVVSVKIQPHNVSVNDLILELEPGHVSDLKELLPYAIKFYLEKGKNLFVDCTYQMFLKRRPEHGIAKNKIFDENNLSESLLQFMQETYESNEARQFYIRRIPGPTSDDFLFRI